MNIKSFLYTLCILFICFDCIRSANHVKDAKSNLRNENENNKTFVAAVLTIFFSGLGDKSFLITAFLAMKHNKTMVFTSSLLSLTLMGIISVEFGKILPNYISTTYIDLFGGVLFIFLGLYFIFNGYFSVSDSNEKDEEEVAKMLNEEKTKENKTEMSIWLQCFGLVFLSELGDKSQIAVICLSSSSSFLTIFIGISIANVLLTIIAIFCGKIVEEYISKKTLEIISGFLFVLFGIFFIQFAFDIKNLETAIQSDIATNMLRKQPSTLLKPRPINNN